MDVARGLTHVARGLTQRLHELTLLTLQLAQQAELALTRCFATAAELQAAEAIIDQEITDNIALREQLDAEVASGVELRAQLALTRDVLAHEQLVSATLRSRRHESAIQNTHAHRDEKLRVRLILQACPARSVPARSVPTHVAFAAHAPTVLGRARQLDQVEAAQAAAASATVKMRMDAESLKLFESLMNAAEMQPPQQRHLRLLLQNQLAALSKSWSEGQRCRERRPTCRTTSPHACPAVMGRVRVSVWGLRLKFISTASDSSRCALGNGRQPQPQPQLQQRTARRCIVCISGPALDSCTRRIQ